MQLLGIRRREPDIQTIEQVLQVAPAGGHGLPQYKPQVLSVARKAPTRLGSQRPLAGRVGEYEGAGDCRNQARFVALVTGAPGQLLEIEWPATGQLSQHQRCVALKILPIDAPLGQQHQRRPDS